MAGRSFSLPPVALVALLSGKALGSLSRGLGRGGGSALPGVVAERIDPRLSSRLAAQIRGGRVLVTGTNGKTTASRMLAGIAQAAGLRPVHNRTGSNLMRGIGTTLLQEATIGGRISGGQHRAGVFEVDEATLPHAVRALHPTAVVFTNLFRDQLDRYGEVDSILSLWRSSLALLPAGATIVLNADDPSVAGLGESYAGPVLYYGVDSSGDGGSGTEEHAADSRWCAVCGAEYAYSPIYYGHLGLWRCPGCGRSRPRPQIVLTDVRGLAGRLLLELRDGGHSLALSVALTGLYNAYNAVAAYAGARALGIDAATSRRGLATFTAAFGRQEQLAIAGRKLSLLLCKNPAGTNQVIGTLLDQAAPLQLLVALNDGVQDGRDVSWIWDVDYERLRGRAGSVTTTGSRAADMALRLKYARLDCPVALEPDPRQALERALHATPPGGTLFVLPTYTAMMELRGMIASMAGQRQFWRQ